MSSNRIRYTQIHCEPQVDELITEYAQQYYQPLYIWLQ